MSSRQAQARGLRAALQDPAAFSRSLAQRPLREYQRRVAGQIWASVQRHAGLTFTVEFPRQSGKNELSAQLEAFLLTRHMGVGGQMVKCAPTFRPQCLVSIRRVREALENPLTQGRYRTANGFRVVLDRASIAMLSAEPGASVVGGTADVLLECDEAQDVDAEKWSKDFLPMGATGNATRVLYGTPWLEDDLLAVEVERALELQRRDGIQRHFEVSWEEVARENPFYGQHVQGEMERLGADHPIVRTQYLMQRLARGGRFFSSEQLQKLQGDHLPMDAPRPPGPGFFVAGLDVAGADEEDPEGILTRVNRGRDSTVLLIGWVEMSLEGNVLEPTVQVVAGYAWRGVPHRQLYPKVLDLLRNIWSCQTVTVDATGVGGGMSAFLGAALGPRIIRPYVYTAATKSQLAYGLVNIINAERLRIFAESVDGDANEVRRELLAQCGNAERELRANQVMLFSVPESRGHDDLLNALALVAQSVAVRGRRGAAGRARPSRELT